MWFFVNIEVFVIGMDVWIVYLCYFVIILSCRINWIVLFFEVVLLVIRYLLVKSVFLFFFDGIWGVFVLWGLIYRVVF